MSYQDWSAASLASLLEDTIGGLWGSPNGSSEPDETDVLVVRSADFRNWDSRRARDAAPRRVPVRSLARRELSPGDLVLEVSGGSPAQPVGRVLVIDDGAVAESSRPLICSNFCRKLRLKSGVDPDFVKRQLDWLYKCGHTDRFQTSTTNIRNLQVDKFLEGTTIVFPSPDVQASLSALLDEIDLRRDRVFGHLVAARKAIERFRQAVLGAACSGRLTDDWRKTQPQETVSPVKRLSDEAAAARRRPLLQADPKVIDANPDGWAVVALDLLVDRIEAGKSLRAEGRSATESEWGVIKVSAMSWGRFLEAENKAIPEDTPVNPRYEVKPGDLLISRANTVDLVGATVLVGETRPKLLLSDKSLRLVLRPGVNKAWLNYALRSQLVRSQFADRATGTSDSMRNLSQDKILATTLPLPPTREQEEIVRRVDRLFALADTLQNRIATATQRADRSSQATLAKAFRGDLLARMESG